MDIVFASHNAHKRAEVEAIMAAIWPDVHLIAPVGEAPEETGDTFEDNALIKARAGYAATGIPTIADDSGICVDALGGDPGVRSARYSPSGDDHDNLDLLLTNLGTSKERRAHFVCAVAFVADGEEHVLERSWHGSIAMSPAGSGGFGYDPIFIPEGQEATAAQLAPGEKSAVSHRGQAFRALADFLRVWQGQ